MTERVKRLREAMLQNNDDRAVFYERMTLLLEADERFSGLGNGEKYARSFSYLLEHMDVFIKPDELIVGSVKEIVMDEAQERHFLSQCARHNVKATELFSFDPLGLLEITDPDERFATEFLCSYGHLIPDWPKLLRAGFDGLKQEARSRMTAFPHDTDKLDFLNNCVITCDAMMHFAQRYHDCAAVLHTRCQDEAEAARYAQIKRTCMAAAHGARRFDEAVQLVWFTMLVLQTVCGARDFAFGRLDQYLYPYYQKDLDAGVLTREQALELLECLFIKCNEIIGMTWEAYHPKRILSVNSLQYIMLSGADNNGNDTTNTISYLILEAVEALGLKQPTVNIIYHPDIDAGFWDEACRIAALGQGFPSFFNDAVVRRALKAGGVSEKNIEGYAYYGCNNSFLPGLEDSLREAWHCVPKYLEFALNHGRSMTDGKVQGAITPGAGKMTTMDDIYDALRRQMAHGIEKAKAHVEQSDAYWNEIQPFNFESVIMTHCIQRAQSMGKGGSEQRHFNNHFVGLATVANSLYALEQLVFADRLYSLETCVRLLKDNWAQDECTRALVKEKFLKFGNNEQAVDDIAQKVAKMFVEEIRKASPMDNGRLLYPSIYSLWHHRNFGACCAATADGRLRGEPLSESQSPVYDTEQKGPTAVFNSIAKLPLDHTPSGGLNVKFQPGLFQTPQGHRIFQALLEGYFKSGGLHVQVNVIGKEELLQAKARPEQHKNLLVRIVGYSSHFVTLTPEQQDEIINRTAY